MKPIHFNGSPCKRHPEHVTGGTTIRYVNRGQCVACAALNSASWDSRHPDSARLRKAASRARGEKLIFSWPRRRVLSEDAHES
jgi:hypothetical protein